MGLRSLQNHAIGSRNEHLVHFVPVSALAIGNVSFIIPPLATSYYLLSQLGSNVQHEIEKKRENNGHSVQRYLI